MVDGGLPVHEEGLRWARQAGARVVRTGVNMSCASAFLAVCVAEFLCVLPSVTRATAFLEVFAGFGDTAKNVAAAGYIARTFEMMNSRFENGCTAVGALYAMYLVASVVPTARSYLMTLASCRCLRITCEQPLNSLFYVLPGVRSAIKMCKLSRHVSWMGGWGGPTMKPDEFYTNIMSDEVRAIVKGHREAVSKLGATRRLALTTRVRKAGSQKHFVIGQKSHLKQSARYPSEFTAAFASLVCAGLSQRAANAARRA
ncbi:unnamed protein product [Prorocentrum cordatum]|uniref:H(+)-exporting diphosphatase n=1 Tax=Prorocentrum cordatum TaxID=2364126 RepID=A0ABN9VDH1_9DINO|nr:unnamed protein product [Polarella glacialis]